MEPETITLTVRRTSDGKEKTGAIKMWLSLNNVEYTMEGQYITFEITPEDLVSLLENSGTYLAIV